MKKKFKMFLEPHKYLKNQFKRIRKKYKHYLYKYTFFQILIFSLIQIKRSLNLFFFVWSGKLFLNSVSALKRGLPLLHEINKLARDSKLLFENWPWGKIFAKISILMFFSKLLARKWITYCRNIFWSKETGILKKKPYKMMSINKYETILKLI